MRRLLLLCVAVFACSGPGPAADGGPERGPDAARDAEPQTDARSHDPPDASAEGAEWLPMPDLPEACALERAARPGALTGLELVWEPCAGLENCERTAPLPAAPSTRFWRVSDGYVLAFYDDEEAREVWFIVPEEGGPPIAAWRGPAVTPSERCDIWSADMHEGRMALAVYYSFRDGRRGNLYYWSSIEEAARLEHPVTVVDQDRLGTSFTQEIYVGREALVAEIQGAGYLAEVSTGTFRPLITEEVIGYPADVNVYGDQIVWTDYGDRPRMARATLSSPPIIYYDPPEPREVRATWVDEGTVAWLETITTEGPVVTRTKELWTAAYQPERDAFRPRYVRAIDLWDFPRAGDGLWAVITGDPYRIEVYSLSDGTLGTFPTPPGFVPGGQRILAVRSEAIVYRTAEVRGALIRFDPRRL